MQSNTLPEITDNYPSNRLNPSKKQLLASQAYQKILCSNQDSQANYRQSLFRPTCGGGGGGGGGTIYSNGFFCSILADRYIHRREM